MLRKPLCCVALTAAFTAAVPASAQQPLVAIQAPQPAVQQFAAPMPGPVAAPPIATVTTMHPGVPTPAAAPQSFVSHPVPVQFTGGNVGAMSPLPTYAVTNTAIQAAPTMTQQTHVYTPTYYWYYYRPPYTVTQYAPVAPVQPVVPVMAAPMTMQYAGQAGPMANFRGEMGHVRYPYSSYRRPWYYQGQPSFNVTIDGPVW